MILNTNPGDIKMSGPYRRGKHRLEHSPESDEDDGSRRVHPFSGSQGESSQQQAYSFRGPPVDPYSNLPYMQQMRQEHEQYLQQHQHFFEPAPQQHLEQYSQQIQQQGQQDPQAIQQEGQEYRHGQYPQPAQHLTEHQGEGSSDEDSSDDDQYEGQRDEPVEHTIDPRYVDPAPTQHQVSGAHQAYGNYATAGAERVTEAFGGLGLTAIDPQPGPSQAAGYSQPGDYSQAIDSWVRERGLPPIHYPKKNPYRQGQSLEDWSLRQELEPEEALNWAEQWDVRVSVACGCHEKEVAANAGRSVASVIYYILGELLMWTLEEDKELKELMAQGADVPLMLAHLNSLEGTERWEDEVEAHCLRLHQEEQLAQSAEMAGSAQSGRQQSPVVSQPGEPGPPKAKRWVARTDRTEWGKHEHEMLKEWGKEHDYQWSLMKEGEIPGRTVSAVRGRWARTKQEEGLGRRLPPRALPALTKEEITSIKCELARNVGLSKILARPQFQGRNYKTVHDALRSANWGPWTDEENKQVSSLQEKEGDEWAQISTEHHDIQRETDEIKARYELYKEYNLLRPMGSELPAPQLEPFRGRYWTAEEDNELALKLAQGWSTRKLKAQGFHGFSLQSIQERAKEQGFSWSIQDESNLRAAKPNPDGTFDWESIGSLFQPPRKAINVKAHWIWLKKREAGEIPYRGVIGDKDIEGDDI